MKPYFDKEESNPLFYIKHKFSFLTGAELQTKFKLFLHFRSHNELVVDKLQYYINYLVQGEYNFVVVAVQFRLCSY
jgi:hypothetical protein